MGVSVIIKITHKVTKTKTPKLFDLSRQQIQEKTCCEWKKNVLYKGADN